jgi:hypothetical protein
MQSASADREWVVNGASDVVPSGRSLIFYSAP